MPFQSNKELSEEVKGTSKLSDRKKRQFRHVFNKCVKEQGESESCYKQGWGAVNNTASVKVASELLKIAKGLIGGEVPNWVTLDWFLSNGDFDLSGTPLKKFSASLHGIRTWALQANGKVYRDQFGWISVNWVILPDLDGSEWKVKSTLSFAPATSGSFAIKKFNELKGLSLVTGDDDFRMFNAFAKSLSIVPNESRVKEDINGLIKTHGKDLGEVKKYWKKQAKDFTDKVREIKKSID